MKSLTPTPITSDLVASETSKDVFRLVKIWLNWFIELGQLLGQKNNNTRSSIPAVSGLTGAIAGNILQSRFCNSLNLNVKISGTFSLTAGTIPNAIQSAAQQDTYLPVFDAGVLISWAKIAAGTQTLVIGNLGSAAHELIICGGVIVTD